MRTFLLAAAAAIVTLNVPATPAQAPSPDDYFPVGVRDARNRPSPPVPGSTFRKSAAPHPRLSLLAAVESASDDDGSTAALPPAAEAIARCESRGDLSAENPTSSASGKYQFIASTWRWVTGLNPPASAYPEHVQDQAFLTLWADGDGASHWAPSAHCWEPILAGGRP